jgi:hypothetical protein
MGKREILAEEQACHRDECDRAMACGGALEEVRTFLMHYHLIRLQCNS